MKIEFDQGTLFSSKKKSVNITPQKSIIKKRPDISLIKGLNKNSIQSESMYILRVLSNQYLKVANYSKFSQVLQAEISIKTGKHNSRNVIRSCLIDRFVQN